MIKWTSGSAVLSGTCVGDPSFPLTRALPDLRFEFGFRTILWCCSSRIFGICGVLDRRGFSVKIPVICGVLVRRAVLVEIPGNCDLFVLPEILNSFWIYVSGTLRGLRSASNYQVLF